jgi:hypothetical protein
VKKRTGSTAAEVCNHLQLSRNSRTLLRENQSPNDFAELLLEQTEYADAVRFIAHALPVRKAVSWATRCARQALTDEAPAEEREAISVAEEWVIDGDDASRRAALPAGDAAGVATAAGGVAVAVFLSGGSLAPPDATPIYPGRYSAARLVAGSILSAAHSFERAETADKFQTFVTQGIELCRAMINKDIVPEDSSRKLLNGGWPAAK